MSLLVRVRDPRDGRAWEQFVEIYRPMLYGYCRRQGLQDADATDLAQDVMQAVAGAVARPAGGFEYDPAKGMFRDWLFTVTRNKLRRFFDRRQRRPAEEGSGRSEVQRVLAEQPAPQESEEWGAEYRRHLFEWAARQARSEFKDTSWRAFLLTAVEGRTAKDAADLTGLSEGAVYTARSRVLARLRELVATVDEQGGPDPVTL